MTFDKLRLSIYESYQNGEINRNTASDMLESVLSMEGDYIVAEADNARSDFMGVALECVSGDVDYAVFEKEAATLGQKIKNVWDKFVAWVKKVIDTIKSKLGFKVKKKVTVNDEFMKGIDKVKATAASLSANATIPQIIAAVASLATAATAIGVGIFKTVKGNGKTITMDSDTAAKNVNEGSAAALTIAQKLKAAKEKWFGKPEEGKIEDNKSMGFIRTIMNGLSNAATKLAKAVFGGGDEKEASKATNVAQPEATQQPSERPAEKTDEEKPKDAVKQRGAGKPVKNKTKKYLMNTYHVKEEDIPSTEREAQALISKKRKELNATHGSEAQAWEDLATKQERADALGMTLDDLIFYESGL